MILNLFQSFFYVDSLALLMLALLTIISCIIPSFAYRYMHGDTHYKSFATKFALLISTLAIFFCADHVILFTTSWIASNLLLVQLMKHKSSWQAAQQSATLTTKIFCIGWISMITALTLLAYTNQTISIQQIVNHTQTHNLTLTFALFLIILASMVQSALLPFHKWITSSLNAPTPVSACMHAGLINGGGFILTRFAPLLITQQHLLAIIFVAGVITTLLGTTWMLIQHDMKRSLACSTVAQMGFMFVQCGLGLFSAAIAHIIWHGLFKAYLFLASDTIALSKPIKTVERYSFKLITTTIANSIFGMMIFAAITNNTLFTFDSRFVLLDVVGVAIAQISIKLLQKHSIVLSLIATFVISTIYAYQIKIIEHWLKSLPIIQPQPISMIHIIGMLLLFGAWLIILLKHKLQWLKKSPYALRLYVTMLNMSQPHSSTITTNRNTYTYL